MFSDRLKTDIEGFATQMRESHPLMLLALEGGVTPPIVFAYLHSIHFLVQHTVVHLSAASRRSEQEGRQDLAVFYSQKAVEEAGHDAWALKDIERLRAHFGPQEDPGVPDPKIADLVRTIEHGIERNPASYLVYILLSEYFTVLAGPAWLKALRERCAIPIGAMTVVENHVELDKSHVAEGLREIGDLIRPEDRADSEHLLRESMDGLNAFYGALYRMHAPQGATHAANAADLS